MKIIVTGAGGFLGSRVAAALLQEDSPVPCSELILTDVSVPATPAPALVDPRVTWVALDLGAAGAAERLVTSDTGLVYHLAAAVSGHAERHFDEGMRANLEATRQLLEALRHRAPGARFLLASTVAVYGGEAVRGGGALDEREALTPQSSYGCAKAMSELLVEEYTRRGWVCGRAVRLPTVTVRPGTANAAVTSFASGMVRSPVAGRRCVVPVPPHTALWVCSPAAAAHNLLRAGALPAAAWAGQRRVLCLPGLRVTAGEAAAALRAAAGEGAARLLHWERDDHITQMVQSFPSLFDCARALSLGFVGNDSFEDIVREYMNELQM